jgi:hypothetical protein
MSVNVDKNINEFLKYFGKFDIDLNLAIINFLIFNIVFYILYILIVNLSLSYLFNLI